jgi:pyruvate-formate lyase
MSISFSYNKDSKVPQRLSLETRDLAFRALSGEFGREMASASFFHKMNENKEQDSNLFYAEIIKKIAKTAPLRILEEEKILGAATLIEATKHNTPGCDISSTSHTTMGFEEILKIGYKGLRSRIETRLDDNTLDKTGRNLLNSMLICLEAAHTWHRRYIDLLNELILENTGEVSKHYKRVKHNLRNVPENPPETFRESIQSLWMMYCFQRLCGNWSGIGRIDKILGPFLKQDLNKGIITIPEARELIAHFWIKGCEWARTDMSGGDGQFYQNIILGGVDEQGIDITNNVTYLVLDVIEELHISDFPIAVRINSRTPEKLLIRVAEVQRLGGGIVAIYNEELIIRSLVKFGYPLEEARNFSNDGCWEVIIPGKTAFSYTSFDMLKLFQEAVGIDDDRQRAKDDFNSFDELYTAFLLRLSQHIDDFQKITDHRFINEKRESDIIIPTPLLSMFVDGCVRKGKSYNNRGAKYSVVAIHAGGIPDLANSLYVINKIVFEEKQFSWHEFCNILINNWKGHEKLRKSIIKKYQLYGNDNDEADQFIKKIYDDFVTLAARTPKRKGVLRPPGISTFGREITYSHHRSATAFGKYQGEILATNMAPTPGTDFSGPTAVIKSFCKLDYEKLPNGVPLELKIAPGVLKGEVGLKTLITIMRSFIDLGGVFLHIDVVDNKLLLEAQQNPEKYPNLSVRISGWSARFATLDREWQDMIIQRTEHRFFG